MSRQRLRFACGQRIEVFKTLIGSWENIDVIESLPPMDSPRDPNIRMSVVIRATQPFRSNETELSHPAL
jgi:hypothetical protein